MDLFSLRAWGWPSEVETCRPVYILFNVYEINCCVIDWHIRVFYTCQNTSGWQTLNLKQLVFRNRKDLSSCLPRESMIPNTFIVKLMHTTLKDCVSGLRDAEHPANRTHNLQLRTRPTTCKPKPPSTTGNNHLYNTLELLMMGIMVSETCWANNKFCNKEQSVGSSWPFYFHV